MKYLIIVLFSFIFTCGNSQINYRLNSIKISPVEFTKAEFQISYERYFGNRSSSIVISPSVILKDSYDESKAGLQGMIQYRFYLTHFNKSESKTFLGLHNYGFYSGVYALYMDYAEDYQIGLYNQDTQEYEMHNLHKESNSIEGGAIVGLQVDITERIVMDFYVGGGIRKTDLSDDLTQEQRDQGYYQYYGVLDPEYQGVKPRVGLQLGMTF